MADILNSLETRDILLVGACLIAALNLLDLILPPELKNNIQRHLSTFSHRINRVQPPGMVSFFTGDFVGIILLIAALGTILYAFYSYVITGTACCGETTLLQRAIGFSGFAVVATLSFFQVIIPLADVESAIEFIAIYLVLLIGIVIAMAVFIGINLIADDIHEVTGSRFVTGLIITIPYLGSVVLANYLTTPLIVATIALAGSLFAKAIGLIVVFIRGLVNKIVTYPNGPLQAIVLIITTVIAVLLAYLEYRSS